jgi:hypothetical protein
MNLRLHHTVRGMRKGRTYIKWVPQGIPRGWTENIPAG